MLQALSIYLLKVICISALLFLYYHLALRNKRFHYYNRFYLLMAVVISAVLPLLQLRWFTFFSSSPQTIHLYKIIYGSGEEEIIINGKTGIDWKIIILYTIAPICCCLLITACRRIVKIKRLKTKFPVERFDNFYFINTDVPSAPFSFLKSIFWRNDINLHSETGKQILQHEITHIQQKHSYDKLFMQFVMCFFWMNPFYYFIKNELYLIHEFIADEKAVKHADADAFARMLLTTQFGKFQFFPAQPIFYSSIKRRLIMLTTSKKAGFNYLRRIMALPLFAVLVCLFAFTIQSKNRSSSTAGVASKKPFTLVLDAGHGGKDYGAFGNGLYEKDIALKIVKKIKALSSSYSIDVILVRHNDVFMPIKEKSEFANAQNADAFISIHVNAEKANPNQSGFEVLLTNDNQQFADQNQALGSAILQNVSKDFKAAAALQQRQVGIWVLKNSNIPSALIECGYITNTQDAAMLQDDAKIELIAKTILQGVVIYANNEVDKSKLYQIENEAGKDTTAPLKVKAEANSPIQLKIDGPSRIDTLNPPLWIVDDKIISQDEMKKIDPNDIESINILKEKEAINKYGDKGKNGVIIITLKPNTTPFEPPVIVKDGFVAAKFPEENGGWSNYLAKNLNASVPAKRGGPPGIYKVTVSFKVDENGNVSQVEANNNPGYGTADEAVRVIAQGPKWIPASVNNKNESSMVKQSVVFQISE